MIVKHELGNQMMGWELTNHAYVSYKKGYE